MSRVARVYLKGGQIIELRGTDFVVTTGKLEGDLRNIAWERDKNGSPDPLFLDMEQVAAVVVSDK